jgi:hypothetical protein
MADVSDIDALAASFAEASSRGNSEDDRIAGDLALALVVTGLKDLRRIAEAVERLVGDPPTHVNLGPDG